MNNRNSAVFLCLFLIGTECDVARSENDAQLYRVDEGVFNLAEGETIDLGDHQWLLFFKEYRSKANCVAVAINGKTTCMAIGARTDFKNPAIAAFYTVTKDVEDRDKCFLDVVRLVSRKGASPTATFRFHCV